MMQASYARDEFSDFALKFDNGLSFRPPDNHAAEEEESEEVLLQAAEHGDRSSEFSFVTADDTNSPVSAEDLFYNGQIRPLFPISGDDPPMKKLFIVQNELTPPSSSSAAPDRSTSASPAPEMRKKSNSTGFSRLWRVRDFLLRSNSDGRDAFVFLGKGEEKSETTSCKSGKGKKGKGKKSETASFERGMSAYEVHYGKKAKEGEKKKSYLPYRQELVGFFTNSSGMSRNVHPY